LKEHDFHLFYLIIFFFVRMTFTIFKCSKKGWNWNFTQLPHFISITFIYINWLVFLFSCILFPTLLCSPNNILNVVFPVVEFYLFLFLVCLIFIVWCLIEWNLKFFFSSGFYGLFCFVSSRYFMSILDYVWKCEISVRKLYWKNSLENDSWENFNNWRFRKKIIPLKLEKLRFSIPFIFLGFPQNFQ
jgi:hypothetical protein